MSELLIRHQNFLSIKNNYNCTCCNLIAYPQLPLVNIRNVAKGDEDEQVECRGNGFIIFNSTMTRDIHFLYRKPTNRQRTCAPKLNCVCFVDRAWRRTFAPVVL